MQMTVLFVIHTHTQKLQSRGEIRKKKKENHARRVGKGWIVIQM